MAVTCGLEKVVLPFIDRGTPIEYELVRAICTVEKQKRKRVGVVETDAPVFGRFSMQGQSPAWQIIDDLKKQYEVIPVSPSQPIPLRKPAAKPGDKEEGFDVLVAIQPSAMGPPECDNLIAAIRAGQPTVLFEDPFSFATNVPGTSQPRRPQDPQMAMFSPQQNLQKGSLKPLWKMLGISFSGSETAMTSSPCPARRRASAAPTRSFSRITIPFPSSPSSPRSFSSTGAAAAKGFDPFNEKDPISSGLQHLVFLAPGHIEIRNTSELADRDFEPLVATGTKSGTLQRFADDSRIPCSGRLNPDRPHKLGQTPSTLLAAHITGLLRGGDGGRRRQGPQGQARQGARDPRQRGAGGRHRHDHRRVLPHPRAGRDAGQGINFDFDNVTFVLNAIDSLAGETVSWNSASGAPNTAR